MNFPLMAVNLTLLAGMAVSVMFLPYGLLQNVINCVLFIVIVAVNFRTCMKAIKMFISKKSGKADNSQS